MSRPRTPNPSHEESRAHLCQLLAQNLFAYRTQQATPLTQTQAAAHVPVHATTWTHWEAGSHFPDALVLLRLRTLGVEIPETWIGLLRHWKRTKMKARHGA